MTEKPGEKGFTFDSYRSLGETRDRIRKLHDVVLELEKVEEEQQVYDLAIEAAENILALTLSAIDVLQDGVLVSRADSSGVPEDGTTSAPPSEGIAGLTYRTKQTFIIDDIQVHEEAAPVLPDYHAMVSVPMGDIGVFQCVSRQVGAFIEEDAEMLEILAAHAAAAVRRIRAQNRLEEKRREAEQLAFRYEVILEGAQDGMFLAEPTRGGEFLLKEANSPFESIIGHSLGEHAEVSVSDLFPSPQRENLQRHLRACEKNQEPHLFEINVACEGEDRYFLVYLSPIVQDGETVRLVGSVRERTAEKAAREALQESEEKYRTLVENANDVIVILQDDRCVYANTAVQRMLGMQKEEVIGSRWMQHIHPSGYLRSLGPPADGSESEFDIYEAELQHKDGSRVHVEVNANMITYQGDPAELVIIRDITQRRRAERQLHYLSFHDQLTGVYNRAYFEEQVSHLDAARQRPLSIVMADINGLKLVNDAFGHQEGDRFLQKVALTLREGCRREDVVARIGGDEFAILLPRTSLGEAEEIAGRLRECCRQSDHKHFTISLSIGVATKYEEEEDIWSLFSEAEEQMYRDKILQQDSVRHSIIHSLTNVLEEKSLETRMHINRLQWTSTALGEELGLGDDDLNNLDLLAQMHDIGKVAISDEILLKPGYLTGEEREQIERHPEIGYRIARSIPEFASVAEAILYHHEWYNGEGYPLGLKAGEIPLLARILAVVDAYDAMTHDRPYREALGRETALAEIQTCAGTQFDPEIAEAFVRMITTRKICAE